MELTLNGVITRVMPVREGVSQSTGKEWRIQEFVLVDDGGKAIAFEVSGADRLGGWALKEGDRIEMVASLESREYNGRYYTRVQAWKLVAKNTAGF